MLLRTLLTMCSCHIGACLSLQQRMVVRSGLENYFKKTEVFLRLKKLKNFKSPKFRFFLFCGQILDRIKFHTLIVICEFCYNSQKRSGRENYAQDVLPGWTF